MTRSLFAAAAIALVSISPVATTASAQATAATVQSAAELPSGDFVRKQKRLKGGWHVEQRGEQTVIVFEDDFRAAGGPDLKVFLSPQTVSDVNGKTAVNGSVLLGELTATKGGQEYIVPAGVNLADFESVLVHCEAYSVLWGGGDL
ncbi:MAG: DM13 domain-containing protein [Pseudomonadota bacterium]